MIHRALFTTVALLIVASVSATAAPGDFEEMRGEWSGTDAMCALGGELFAAQYGTIYRIARDGEISTLNDDGWGDTHGMAALGDDLYVACKKGLYRIDLDGEYRTVSMGWEHTHAMCALDGKLLIACGETLYRVDTDGKEESLGSGFEQVTAMAAHNGLLYFIEGEHLFRLNTDDSDDPLAELRPRAKDLGSRFAGTVAMAPVGDQMFMVTGDWLMSVDLSTYEKTRIADEWDGAEAMAAFNGDVWVAQGGMMYKVATK